MSLVFYDTETTGTDTFFDQILQFAAVRTDEELTEIDRFQSRCRLLHHVVPAPEAMTVTGVTVFKLTDPSSPSHYEMIRAIHAKLSAWSPALFVGWNSMEFDEKLIRQALYKTLHNPYLTNRVGNSRSDVMRMAQASSLFAPGALTIPTGDDGRMVFKLDQVAPANGFRHDLAHDAMGDVQATIFICRLLMANAPNVWSSFMRFSKKAAVVDYITDEPMFCVSDFYFGRPHSCIVTTIGQNKDNGAEWYVYDLSVDPNSIASLSDAQLADRLAHSPKPVRRLRANAAPMLFPAEDAPPVCKGREETFAVLERRAAMLKKDTSLRERLVATLEATKEEYPASLHVEKQIYDRFIDAPDQELMDAFHEAQWSDRHAIVKRFSDPRLRTIGEQLIHCERPELLGDVLRRRCDLLAARRLLGHGDEIAWLTLPQARQQIAELLGRATGTQLELLREHQRFLDVRHEQALAHLGDS